VVLDDDLCAILNEPDEHVRFVAYLDELRQVAEPGEIDVVSQVLSDPDQTMAQSAVLQWTGPVQS